MNASDQVPPNDLLACWFGSVPFSITSVPPGLSGAKIWRIVEHPESEGWALRRWPAGTSRSRIEQIDALVQMAIDRRFPFFPPLRLSLHQQRHLRYERQFYWECRQWLTGESIAGDVAVVLPCAQQLASASAAFSETVAGSAIAPIPSSDREKPPSGRASAISVESGSTELILNYTPGPLKSLVRRQHRLQWYREHIKRNGVNWQRAADHHPLFRNDPDAKELVRVARTWFEEFSGPASRAIASHSQTSYPVCATFGDLHLQNALFTAGQLSGLVDIDAIGWDSPAAELSRLIGSLEFQLQDAWSENSERIWTEVLAAYRRIRPFSDQEEMLARTLVQWTPGISLANWLFWLLDEQRQFDVDVHLLKLRVLGWGRIVGDRLRSM